MFPSLPKWWLCAWIKHTDSFTFTKPTLTFKGVSDQVDFFKYKTVCPSAGLRFTGTHSSQCKSVSYSLAPGLVLKIALFICSSQNTTKITPLSWDCGEMCSALSAERLCHHRAPQINLACVWSTVPSLASKLFRWKIFWQSAKNWEVITLGLVTIIQRLYSVQKRSKLT